MNESIRPAHNENWSANVMCEMDSICWLAKTFLKTPRGLEFSALRSGVGRISLTFVFWWFCRRGHSRCYGNNRWRFLFCTCILGCDSNAQQDLSMFFGRSFFSLRADFLHVHSDNDNFIWKIIYSRSSASSERSCIKKDAWFSFGVCNCIRVLLSLACDASELSPKQSEIVARAIMKMRESVPALRH
jgi:hypothetical protein